MELSSTPKAIKRVANYILTLFDIQVILVGTLTGVQKEVLEMALEKKRYSKWLWRKKSRLTRSTVIKLPVNQGF